MLINFTFANHRSFREQTELSFVASGSLKEPGYGSFQPSSSRFRLLNVAGLFGANASGKSNVLFALRFFRSSVVNSHTRWNPDGPIPLPQFRLDRKSAETPSSYQVDLLLDGVPVQYGFSLTRDEIREEWLYAWPGGRRQIWLARSGPQKFDFGRLLKGQNQAIARLTRPNSLFLSTAAQNNHEQLMPLYRQIDQKILFAGLDDEHMRAAFTMHLVRSKAAETQTVLDMMREADLGVVGITVDREEIDFPPAVRELVVALRQEDATDDALSSIPEPLEVDRLRISHASREEPEGITFDIKDESDGTLRWFALIGPILRALAEGALLVVDELNTSLHELLQAELVRRFNDPAYNPRGAQLLFNSQDSTLLGDLLGNPPPLRRDQIWFADKAKDGSSTLTPLTDFRVRGGENIQRRYLQGRFRAVPYLEGLRRIRLFRDQHPAVSVAVSEASGD
jgi:predicted ATPase